MYNPLRSEQEDDDEPWPMPRTLGGPIRAHDHVGHMEAYHRLLASVRPAQVGALCTGDRRQGKTSMLNLLEAVLLASDGARVLRFSAETSKPEVLKSRLSEQVRRASWLGREAERWALDLEVSSHGFTLRRAGGKREPSRPDETDDLLVAAARKAAPRKLVVVIDEITVLVEALAGGGDEGLEFLRALRRARQEGADNLAMVLSGSMGLHHVVPTMQPVNDLVPVRIGSLTGGEARFLARCLFLGAGLEATDEAVATAAEVTDGGAFYVHHLIDRLTRVGRPVAPASISDAMHELIVDTDDPLNFRHYRDRLGIYYGADAGTAAAVLDAIAIATTAAPSVDEIKQAVEIATAATIQRDEIVSVVERLEGDHYVERASGGERFASDVLRQAWRTIRRLEP